MLERVGPGLPPADPAGYADTLAAVRAMLSDSAFNAAFGDGRALPAEETIATLIAEGEL